MAAAKPGPPPVRPLDTEMVDTPFGLMLHRVGGQHAQEVLQVMHGLVGDTKQSRQPRFPGPNPVSLERAFLETLDARDYWICEKTDGTRCALVFAMCLGHRVAALVDRKLHVYLLPLRTVPEVWFQGTVLDGEIAYDKQAMRYRYLVFDAVMASGVPLYHRRLSERLDALGTAMKDYRTHPADAAAIVIKRFFPLMALAAFRSALPGIRARYDVDGVVLTPDSDEIVYGRHMRLFKLKPFGGPVAHTVDFLVARDGVSLQVYGGAGAGGGHVIVGKLTEPAAAGTVAECEPTDDRASGWRVVKVRTDKTTANDEFTFEKTLLNIREGLTLTDLETIVTRQQRPDQSAQQQSGQQSGQRSGQQSGQRSPSSPTGSSLR